MDYRGYTIDEIMTNPDLKLGFVRLYVDLYPNADTKSLLNGCSSCIVKAYHTYINNYQNKIVMIEQQNDCKYELVKPSMLVTVHGSTPLSRANLTDKRVETLINHNKAAAGHFKRKDGRPVLTFLETITEVKVSEQPTMETTTEKPEVKASKAAIRLANAKGIDITTVTGTGKDGNITKTDVENLL